MNLSVSYNSPKELDCKEYFKSIDDLVREDSLKQQELLNLLKANELSVDEFFEQQNKRTKEFKEKIGDILNRS